VGACIANVLFATPSRASATFIVDTTDDDVDVAPGDGICATASGACALRAAVQEANRLPGEDLIRVPAGLYALTLQDTEDAIAARGDLDVSDDLRVVGDGPDATILDGQHMSRLFEQTDLVRLVLVDLRLQNGEAFTGGALLALSSIVLKRVVVASNHAVNGGGVLAFGDFRMVASSILDNVAGVAPGLAVGAGIARIRNSVFARNAYDGAPSALGGKDILANTGGRLLIRNTTIAGEIGNFSDCEEPPFGYCIFGTDIVLSNVTVDLVSFNHQAIDGRYTARNSVIGSCTTAIRSAGYLLIGTVAPRCSVAGDMTGVTLGLDPMLDQLADNGGSTLTRMPLAGSPAIDAGSPEVPGSVIGACLRRDQRGIARPINHRCDLGAVEAGS